MFKGPKHFFVLCWSTSK